MLDFMTFSSSLRFLLAVAFCVLAITPLHAQDASDPTFPPPQAYAALQATFKETIDPHRSINGLAQDCLMYLGAKPRAAGIKKAGEIAEIIIARRFIGNAGDVGWGLNMDDTDSECDGAGTMRGLEPGSCDPPGTSDMYHTGLAISCLAKYASLSGNKDALSTAEDAAKTSWKMGRYDVPCKGCFTYWPTYSPNDKNRYVRNRSAVMGMGMAWLYKATGNKNYANRARAVANAEHGEIAAGNVGFFSIDDLKYIARPDFEGTRIENHVPLSAKSLMDIGRNLNDIGIRKDAAILISQWLTCTDKRCLANPCKYWGGDLDRCNGPETMQSCQMRKISKPAAAHCESASAQLLNWNKRVLWHVLDN